MSDPKSIGGEWAIALGRICFLGMVAGLVFAGCEVSVGSKAKTPEEEIAIVPIPWNSTILYGSVEDARDGSRYNTVRIGSQEWMAENLRFIPTGSTVGVCLKSDPTCTRYGRFYRWSEALALPPSYDTLLRPAGNSRPKGICPTGWHLPSYEEVWLMKTSAASRLGLDPSAVAMALKSGAGWIERDSTRVGSDSLGFRMIAGGACNTSGYGVSCSGTGYTGAFWTHTESSAPNGIAYAARFSSGSRNFDPLNESKSTAINVRCVRD